MDNDATFDKLRSKHPAAPADRDGAADQSITTAMQVTADDVRKAIRTFPAGSSGGPDGLRPQHVLDMIMNGKCHPAVTPILFGGNLVALEK